MPMSLDGPLTHQKYDEYVERAWEADAIKRRRPMVWAASGVVFGVAFGLLLAWWLL